MSRAIGGFGQAHADLAHRLVVRRGARVQRVVLRVRSRRANGLTATSVADDHDAVHRDLDGLAAPRCTLRRTFLALPGHLARSSKSAITGPRNLPTTRLEQEAASGATQRQMSLVARGSWLVADVIGRSRDRDLPVLEARLRGADDRLRGERRFSTKAPARRSGGRAPPPRARRGGGRFVGACGGGRGRSSTWILSGCLSLLLHDPANPLDDDAARVRILDELDPGQLDRWLARAATCTSVAELFTLPGPP